MILLVHAHLEVTGQDTHMARIATTEEQLDYIEQRKGNLELIDAEIIEDEHEAPAS